VSRPLTIVIDGRSYVAPRVSDAASQGRAVRRARCGHDVYLSKRGLDAIGRQGKRLMCDQCYGAVRVEHGARFATVWWPDDDEDPVA
jgi:uncharacterized membrane-anchored protein